MFEQEFKDIKSFRPQVSRSLQRASASILANQGSFSAVLGNSFRQTIGGIFSDKRMDEKTMLGSHIEQTKSRIKESEGEYVICAQDTTSFNYNGHEGMSDLGYLQDKHLGIYQHNLLAISQFGVPLGILHQEYWSRQSSVKSYKGVESQKWFRGLNSVNSELSNIGKRAVLVEDREADMFAFFKASREENVDFLVRVHQPRHLEIVEAGKTQKLSEIKDHLNVLGEREVQIWRERSEVHLTLRIRATAVNVLPGKDKSAAKHKTQGLYLVIAEEIAAYDEKEKNVFVPSSAACWYLLTSIEVKSFDQACMICDFYALRWRIERLHYTLKTGAFNVENLQFDDLTTTINALAFYSIIAWEVLYLLYYVRQNPDLPPTKLYSEEEIKLLSAITKRPVNTIYDFILALGFLAGFARSKAQPLPGIKKLTEAIQKFNYIKIGAGLSKPLQG